MKSPKATYRTFVVAISGVVVVGLLAVAICWYFVLQMSHQVRSLDTETQNMNHESSQLSELSIRLQKVLPLQGLVYGAIPTSKDESTFMADLESVAKTNGITITSSVVGDTKAKATLGNEFSQTIQKQEYYELPIRYEVVGQYASFTKFINDLSTLRRLNSVDNVSVTLDNSDVAVVGRVKAIFNVTIYAKKQVK
jgi:Tfp pilus assembly protein PilO